MQTPDSELIDSLRRQSLQRGLGGVRGLSILFRGMDRNFSKSVTYDEFTRGLTAFGISMTLADLRIVFDVFDKDRSGEIDFREFLEVLRPPMPECRKRVIAEAFSKIDANKDGVLTVEDLKVVYTRHAVRHPKYVRGEWTLDQVLREFISSFDDPNNQDGSVTPEEFLNYYAGVSSAIADDEYFDLMMRAAWGLPHVSANAGQNTKL